MSPNAGVPETFILIGIILVIWYLVAKSKKKPAARFYVVRVKPKKKPEYKLVRKMGK